VRIKDVFSAVLTAHDIEQLVKAGTSQQAKKPNAAIDLEVKNPQTNVVQILRITVHGSTNRDLIRAHTDDGGLVLIRLGAVAERQLRHPSVILATKEPTRSVGQRARPISVTSKRR
jgi:hypothetical protein